MENSLTVNDFSIGSTVFMGGDEYMVTEIYVAEKRLIVCPVIASDPDTCDGARSVVVNPEDLHF